MFAPHLSGSNKVVDVEEVKMTSAEGIDHPDLLLAIAKVYVESDLTWSEAQEISLSFEQGYSFNTVIDELHFRQQLSSELSIMTATLLTSKGNFFPRHES